MECPVCQNVTLVMMERQNIEIDYCPQCRGVWLDRGELDKIIERSSPEPAARPSPAPERPLPPAQAQSRPAQRHEGHEYGRHRKKKKRESFLEDLFDF